MTAGFAVARWTGPAIDRIGPATDWVGPATGWSVLISAERTTPWDVIPCNSAWAVEAPAGTSRPSRTSSRGLCVFLVLASRCLGPIMVQTSLVRARRQDLGTELRRRTLLERLRDATAGSAVTPRSIPRCDVASPDTSGAFEFFEGLA